MGLTLDQLLDQTGIRGMSGGQEKTASSAQSSLDFAKLAERCRQAAEGTPSAGDPALTEKVAQVAIVRHTLRAIQSIEDGGALQKTAAPTVNEAAFIKEALSRGHSPKDIATFLEKEAFLGRMMRAGKQRWELARTAKAMKGQARAAEKVTGAARRWDDVLRSSAHLPEAQKVNLIRRMGRGMDPADVRSIVEKGPKEFKGLQAYKDLTKNLPKGGGGVGGAAGAAKKPAFGVNIGDTTFDAGEFYKKHKKTIVPGAVGAGGVMALRGRDGDSGGGGGKGGPVIINR